MTTYSPFHCPPEDLEPTPLRKRRSDPDPPRERREPGSPPSRAELAARYRTISKELGREDIASLSERVTALERDLAQRDHRLITVTMRAVGRLVRDYIDERIGELSMELDASKGGSNPKATLPSGGKSKADALAEAGISTSTAEDGEQ